MIRSQKVFFIRFAYILLDILCVVLAVFIACLLRKQVLFFPITFKALFFDPTNPFQFVFIFLTFAVIFFNNLHGLYQTRRELIESIEVWEVIKSIFYAGILTIVAIYILKIEGFPRSILILTTILTSIFLSIWRILKRFFVEFLVIRGYNNFNVLIVGAGKVGEALVGEIEKRPTYGLKVIGFLDDFQPTAQKYAGHEVLGKIADFRKIARREFINKVFITTHHDSEAFLQLLEQARRLRIAVRVIPHGFELTTGEFFKYNIGFIPVLEYCDEELAVRQAGKRLFDFIMTFFLTIVSFPFILAISILIKLDSPGPVFYLSKRYGRRGRKFFMYKFRSMMTDADQALEHIRHKNEVDGPIFKIRNDPRITRVGRFLRKFSLDELPQIINVLKGEMSLVGPRPLPIEQIQKEDLRQLKRLEVRPGITGLWQVRGRSDVSFSRLVRWDIWYINNWSFWLDLNVLMQTIPVILKGKGAY